MRRVAAAALRNRVLHIAQLALRNGNISLGHIEKLQDSCR